MDCSVTFLLGSESVAGPDGSMILQSVGQGPASAAGTEEVLPAEGQSS